MLPLVPDRNKRRPRCGRTPRYKVGTGADGNLVVSSDTPLTSTLDGDVVVKNYTTLTIDAGKTLTVSNRCKGLVIFVQGDCVINGILTMTARGASAAASGTRGFDVSTVDGSVWFDSTLLGGPGAVFPQSFGVAIPLVGANGGVAVTATTGSSNGTNGSSYTTIGQTGGGGAGAACGGNESDEYVVSGAGAAGTAYSGGSGGGSSSVSLGPNYGTWTGYSGAANGGAGGAGYAVYGPGIDLNISNLGAGGGAGNPGGATAGDSDYIGTGVAAQNGTGGILMLIVGGRLTVNGTVSANGSNGGYAAATNRSVGGGGSGGGSIVILYGKQYINNGTVSVDGGKGGQYSTNPKGGDGGAGSIQIARLT